MHCELHLGERRKLIYIDTFHMFSDFWEIHYVRQEHALP